MRALQVVVGTLSLIPAYFGALNLYWGVGRFLNPTDIVPELDSQFRFQSAVYLGLAAIIWWIIPRIDQQKTLFRIIVFALFLGGLGRLYSFLTVGPPNTIMIGAMILELALPVLVVWQNAVSKQAH